MQLNLNLPKLPGRRGKFSRDIFLIIVGAAGLLNEAFIENGERPTLIIAFLACMGFPVFLRTDEKVAAQTPQPPSMPTLPPIPMPPDPVPVPATPTTAAQSTGSGAGDDHDHGA